MKLFKEVISIKLRINGYTKCLTTNELTPIDTIGSKTKNKIKYEEMEQITTIIIRDKELILNRESTEFQNTLIFKENKHTISNYLVKENDLNLEINIYTKNITIDENKIKVNYLIEDSNYEYEYLIELGG